MDIEPVASRIMLPARRGEMASMLRLAAIFVVVCMVLIAGSAGAWLYLLLRARASGIHVVAVAILSGLGHLQCDHRPALRDCFERRRPDRRPVARHRRSRPPGRRAGRAGLAAHGAGDRSATRVDKTRGATDALSGEIGELGALVKQLAETVAAHEAKLAELARRPALPAVSIAEALPPRPEVAPAIALPHRCRRPRPSRRPSLPDQAAGQSRSDGRHPRRDRGQSRRPLPAADRDVAAAQGPLLRGDVPGCAPSDGDVLQPADFLPRPKPAG